MQHNSTSLENAMNQTDIIFIMLGFSKHTVKYSRDIPYWSIDGRPISEFKCNLRSNHSFITYAFFEVDGECRKIGEGSPNRLHDNLKAHYNHGRTKSPYIENDRITGNSIAIRCRNDPYCILFIRPAKDKKESRLMELVIKKIYKGWLDFDQQ